MSSAGGEGGGGGKDSEEEEEDLIEVVVLDCEGNRIIEEQHGSNEWKTIQIDRSQLGEGFRSAPVGNIAVQQLVDQPGSFVVVLYDEVETEKAAWNRTSVIALIDCYKKNKTRIEFGNEKKKIIWEEIANDVYATTGQRFTCLQAQSKWKQMEKKFREVVEHNSIDGNAKRSYIYFKELLEVYKPGLKMDGVEETELPSEESGSGEINEEDKKINNRLSLMKENGNEDRNKSFVVGVKFKWNSDSVHALINCYERKKSKFRNSFHKKKNIWQEIAKAIHSETGQLFTWFQVEAKWKNITKKFRDVVDHNCRPGNAKRTCSYFSELQRVYRYHPCEKPASKAADEEEEDEEEEDNTEGQDEVVVEKETDLAAGLKPRRVIDPSTRDPLLGFLRKMHSDNRALAVKQMALQKAMHDEKMAAFGQIIDILKTTFCK